MSINWYVHLNKQFQNIKLKIRYTLSQQLPSIYPVRALLHKRECSLSDYSRPVLGAQDTTVASKRADS